MEYGKTKKKGQVYCRNDMDFYEIETVIWAGLQIDSLRESLVLRIEILVTDLIVNLALNIWRIVLGRYDFDGGV